MHGFQGTKFYCTPPVFCRSLNTLSTTNVGMSNNDLDAGAPSSGLVPLLCGCGRYFSHQSALTNHTRSCELSKKRLASALDKAQDVWRKRRKKKEEILADPEAAMLVDDPNLIEVSF